MKVAWVGVIPAKPSTHRWFCLQVKVKIKMLCNQRWLGSRPGNKVGNSWLVTRAHAAPQAEKKATPASTAITVPTDSEVHEYKNSARISCALFQSHYPPWVKIIPLEMPINRTNVYACKIKQTAKCSWYSELWNKNIVAKMKTKECGLVATCWNELKHLAP